MLVIPFTILLVLAQLVVPRRFGFVPLLAALLHIGNGAVFSEFTPMRLVLIAGLCRALAGGFLQWAPENRLDKLFFAFSIIALFSTVGHQSSLYVPSPLLERCGLVLNVLGAYLFSRSYVSAETFSVDFPTWLAILIIPLGVLLGVEQGTGRNQYVQLGSRGELAATRNDRNRAKGPFGHAIIAGTATAVSVPFMILLLRRRKALAVGGLVAALIGTLATASSGPLAALAVVLALLLFWHKRQQLRRYRHAFWLLLIFLHFTMSRPVWFLISRIDLVGGSTGWHRSKLIDTAISDWKSWWLFGTDYTRHWMFSGVTWTPDHTDITNYYLQIGVYGGLPLMVTFIAIIVVAMGMFERSMTALRETAPEHEFAVWCIWTSIAAHSVSFLSIAYFDQSYAGFFLIIAAAPSYLVLSQAASIQQDGVVRNTRTTMVDGDCVASEQQ